MQNPELKIALNISTRMMSAVNGLKTIGMLMMIAMWLSSGFLAHPLRARLAPEHRVNATAFLMNETGIEDEDSYAILPTQQFRTCAGRLTGPLGDSPPLAFSQADGQPVPAIQQQADAPGLALVALAHGWQFLQRAASFPRSPSLA